MELEYNADKNILVNQDGTTAEYERKMGNLDKRIGIMEHVVTGLKNQRSRMQGLINDIKGLNRKLNNPRARTAGENETFTKRVESTTRRLDFLFEKTLKLKLY